MVQKLNFLFWLTLNHVFAVRHLFRVYNVYTNSGFSMSVRSKNCWSFR